MPVLPVRTFEPRLLFPPFLRRGLAAAVLVSGLLGPPPQPSPASRERGQESRRLAAGEVLISWKTVKRDAPREGIGRGVIDFPPERVFRAITDYANYDEFMPFVEEAEVVRTLPDGAVLSSQRLDLPGPFGDRHYTVKARHRVEHPQKGKGGKVWKAEWAYVPGTGDIADQRGSWTLVELSPGRTLATFRLYSDPGRGVPRWAIERGLAETLPWIFEGLRLHTRRSRYDDDR